MLIGSNGFFVNLFFFQTFVDIVAKQLIYDRCCWDKKQHSRNTHQASADGYGYQNPDGRKSDGVSNHMRIDEVPFNLLKNQKHDQESNGSDWVDHQKKEGPDCASDEGSENRNQSGKSNQYTDKQGVREAENAHRNKEHHSKDHSFHTLAGQEI